MKPTLPPTQWLVFTPHAVNGTHWHRAQTRAGQRRLAKALNGYCYETRRSKH